MEINVLESRRYVFKVYLHSMNVRLHENLKEAFHGNSKLEFTHDIIVKFKEQRNLSIAVHGEGINILVT